MFGRTIGAPLSLAALVALVLLPALHPGRWTHPDPASRPAVQAVAQAAEPPCALCVGAGQARNAVAPLAAGELCATVVARSPADRDPGSAGPGAPCLQGRGPRAPPRLA